METNPFRAHRDRASRKKAASRPPAPDDGAAPERGRAGAVGGWVAERVGGRSWRLRAPLLLVFAWMLHGYLGDAAHTSIFDGVNLVFHEAGHAAFFWSGSRIVTVAGGTIFQLGIPIAAGLYLLRKQGDPFGAAVCLFWLGTAFVGAGVYAADARAQALPLVSPFGPVDVDSHDWTFMLMKYGMLSRDQEIGATLRAAGLLSMTLSLAAGVWVLSVMASASPSARSYAGTEHDPLVRGAAAEGGPPADGSGAASDQPAAPPVRPPAPTFRSYLDPE